MNGRRSGASEAKKISGESIKNAPIPVIMQAEDGEVIEIKKTWDRADRLRTRGETKRLICSVAPLVMAPTRCAKMCAVLFAGESSIEPTEFEIETQDGECHCRVFSAWPVGTLFDGRGYIVGTALMSSIASVRNG